jgi:hypothetical protein
MSPTEAGDESGYERTSIDIPLFTKRCDRAMKSPGQGRDLRNWCRSEVRENESHQCRLDLRTLSSSKRTKAAREGSQSA